jgi:hypothetical protein
MRNRLKCVRRAFGREVSSTTAYKAHESTPLKLTHPTPATEIGLGGNICCISVRPEIMAMGIAHRTPEFRVFNLSCVCVAGDHGHGDCTQNT